MQSDDAVFIHASGPVVPVLSDAIERMVSVNEHEIEASFDCGRGIVTELLDDMDLNPRIGTLADGNLLQCDSFGPTDSQSPFQERVDCIKVSVGSGRADQECR